MDIQKEWYTLGEAYAIGINDMVAFAEEHGWDKWKGKEPKDNRENMAEKVLTLLKEANRENKVDEFREKFPPSHIPFIKQLEKNSQSIEQLYFIDKQKIAFVTGTSYQKRQAFLLDGDKVSALSPDITAIGKSKQGNVFAIATEGKIQTFQGWNGTLIKEFKLDATEKSGITELIPFNDGKQILLVSSSGIFLLKDGIEKLIHPLNEENDEEWTSDIDMENATLSNDNQFIVAGDQGYDHRILDSDGNKIGMIGPQSSYPHFCLFSKDDSQLITNSCHFYNGVTIGVDAKKLNGMDIEAYTESDDYVVIDDQMRIYKGIAISDYYILGDAYGYLRAIDKAGKLLWRHYLGSTITGMSASDDEKIVWVGSHSGILHKLQLNKGHRDTHTIGTGNHYEEFRLIIWKDEPQIWKW